MQLQVQDGCCLWLEILWGLSFADINTINNFHLAGHCAWSPRVEAALRREPKPNWMEICPCEKCLWDRSHQNKATEQWSQCGTSKTNIAFGIEEPSSIKCLISDLGLTWNPIGFGAHLKDFRSKFRSSRNSYVMSNPSQNTRKSLRTLVQRLPVIHSENISLHHVSLKIQLSARTANNPDKIFNPFT